MITACLYLITQAVVEDMPEDCRVIVTLANCSIEVSDKIQHHSTLAEVL